MDFDARHKPFCTGAGGFEPLGDLDSAEAEVSGGASMMEMLYVKRGFKDANERKTTARWSKKWCQIADGDAQYDEVRGWTYTMQTKQRQQQRRECRSPERNGRAQLGQSSRKKSRDRTEAFEGAGL